MVADMGVAGETNDGGIRAGRGVGDRRHRLCQARGAFGGSGAAIFRDVGQSRQLPSCRERAPCGRARTRHSGLAPLSAGELGEGSATARRGGDPPEVNFQTKWQLGLDILDQVRGWGLADQIVLSDAAYGDATEFRDGLETRGLPYIVGISSSLGVWTEPPTAVVPARHSGRGAPATRHDYGKQRPMSVLEAARKAKGWKVVRWRQGTKGWLESRFVAMRVQPSHGFVRGETPHK